MGINLGQTPMTAVYLGQTAVKSVFFGNVAVWQGGEEPPVPQADAVCFTALENSSSIRLNKTSGSPAISIEYSTDGEAWSTYTWSGNAGTLVNLAAAGDKVYFRAKNDNAKLATKESSNYSNFVGTGKLAASGNMMALLKSDGTLQDLTDSNDCAFACLFDSCTSLYDASQLELPSKYVPYAGYANMFYGCSNLSAGPDIPALSAHRFAYGYMFSGTAIADAPDIATTTMLSSQVYHCMFQDCTSLTGAPELPATTLATNCYTSMFQGCTSLTTAPTELPATTLTNGCYSSMFKGCTSLAQAPAISGTSTAPYRCCKEMFSGCSQISSIEVGFTYWGIDDSTTNWLSGVAASGTFTCPEGLDTTTRNASRVPEGWTVVNPVVAPWLCFTAETANSKLQLDKVGSPGAVSLEYSTDGVTWSDYTWSGSDGATLTLAAVGDKVYMRAKNENQTFSTDYQNYYKFANYVAPRIAVSGNIQTLLKADGSRTDAPAYCFRSLFSGCSWLTQAPNLPATTIGSSCYTDMFNGCTSLTTAPATLPATTLATWCYNNMFYGCTSLTTALALPATTLADYCYQNMFRNCSSLSSVEVAFSTWPGGATYSTTNWLNGVAASGTFTCPAELPDTRDASHIPSGWTKVDAA